MLVHVLFVIVAVAILWKAADLFVEGAVGIAEKLNVPHMFVGLVIVSLATTSPELMASVMAAYQGIPEMALGNAVGSVSFDAAVALGLAAVVSATPLQAHPRIFRSSAIILVIVFLLAFALSLDGTLARHEGALLVAIYVVHTTATYINLKRKPAPDPLEEELAEELQEIEAHIAHMSGWKIAAYFVAGLAGVLAGSKLLLEGAIGIGDAFNISQVTMGLIVVALGTSTPEVATCVASALKRKGGIGIGNIIGADILNICWVAGLSAVVNPLTARKIEIYVMFPSVFVIVLVMLAMLRYRYRLTRLNGVVLILLFFVYVGVLFYFVPPGELPVAEEPGL